MRLSIYLRFIIIVFILVFCIYYSFIKHLKILNTQNTSEQIEDPGFRILYFLEYFPYTKIIKRISTKYQIIKAQICQRNIYYRHSFLNSRLRLRCENTLTDKLSLEKMLNVILLNCFLLNSDKKLSTVKLKLFELKSWECLTLILLFLLSNIKVILRL